eukprot:scaffold11.g3916.t1
MPPKKTAGKKPPTKKAAGEGGEKKKGKGRPKSKAGESYKLYLYKVLKQVHPDTGISSKAMAILNSFIIDQFEKIASQAAQLSRVNKRPTLTSREIQTAVRLVLPGELAKHAVSEGTKAVTKFTSSQNDKGDDEHEAPYFEPAEDFYALNGQTRLNQATANLATTIIGAGIMALPHAFATMGLLLGSAMLLLGLVHVSQVTKKWTYVDLTRAEFGQAGVTALQLAIILNNAGSMVVYLVIIGDVLVGVPPLYSGLLTNVLGIHDPSLWYISRPFVVGMVCILFLLPLLSLRDLSMLGPMSTVGVGIAALFATSIVALAGVAIGRNMVGNFSWLPTMELLGGSPSRVAIHLLAVLPVVSMAFICHYNVHPVAHRRGRKQRGGTTVVFGSHTDANILNNLTPENVTPLVGAPLARFLCFAVRAGYCVCLVSTFALLNWALRETVSNLVFGAPSPPGAAFYGLSWGLLAAVYLTSIFVPNVWYAMSLFSATAVFVAFILPGMLTVRLGGERWRVGLAWACVVLGCVMGVVVLVNTLFLSGR